MMCYLRRATWTLCCLIWLTGSCYSVYAQGADAEGGQATAESSEGTIYCANLIYADDKT